MMTALRSIILAVAALALCAAPAAAPRPAAEAAQQIPQRIVSLVPAVTEMLFAMGAGSRVVAVSSFDKYPEDVEKLPRVGALLDPDLERILALKPDLVIVYRSQTDLLAQLERAKIPAYVYAHAGLADVTATIRSVGVRVGAGTQAQSLATGIERAIEQIRQRPLPGGRPRALIVFGREALSLRGIYASGGVGFVNDMVAAAGADNVFADVKREAVQATTEMILARRPDVILELRAEPMNPALREKERRVWNTLPSVPAVRSGRIYIIEDPRTVVPGPRVAEGVELIARTLGGGK